MIQSCKLPVVQSDKFHASTDLTEKNLANLDTLLQYKIAEGKTFANLIITSCKLMNCYCLVP